MPIDGNFTTCFNESLNLGTNIVIIKGEKCKRIFITKRNLHWSDWQRYSSRQKTKIMMGGFMGDLILEGELEPFRDLLAYSEILHVGKGCVFGLGKVEIE